jgi:hypothetical protein
MIPLALWAATAKRSPIRMPIDKFAPEEETLSRCLLGEVSAFRPEGDADQGQVVFVRQSLAVSEFQPTEIKPPQYIDLE